MVDAVEVKRIEALIREYVYVNPNSVAPTNLHGVSQAAGLIAKAFKAAALSPATGRAEGDWQDIANAPTNKAVQVWVPGLDYYGNDGVYAGMLVDMGTGRRWMTFAWAMGRDMQNENVPTHWRPLPVPPAGRIALSARQMGCLGSGSAPSTKGGLTE